jgi:hypothetical protein
VTRQNPSKAGYLASQPPSLSTPDDTEDSLDVLAAGKVSPFSANVSPVRRGGARHDKRLPVADQVAVFPFLHEAAEIRVAARWRVNEGLITLPPCCDVCARKVRLTGHHEAYSAPFDLIFLCGRCHTKRHLRLRSQGRDPLVVYARERLSGAPHPLPRKRENSTRRATLSTWVERVRALDAGWFGEVAS